MTIVRLNKNSTLHLETDLLNGRTGFIEYSYEEVERLLNPPPKKLKRSTPNGRVSRILSLYLRALNTGQWSTGSRISSRVTYERLVNYLTEAHEDLKAGLSSKTLDTLGAILNHDLLLSEEKKSLRSLLYNYHWWWGGN